MAPKNDQPFPELYVRLREIKSTRPVQNPSDGHPCRVPRIQWIPPGCKDDFETVSTWGWHLYVQSSHPGGQNIFTRAFPQCDASWLPSHIEGYDSCSMFYSTELNTFLQVPYDCTDKNASEYSNYDEDGWNRITFGRPPKLTNEHPHLWIMGHALARTQMDADVYITDSWDSLILPGSFENGVQHRNTLPTCELAGKLTMILGAVAFATSRDDLISMIRESFRAPSTSYYVPVWARQPSRRKDRGLINQRGLVIDVAFDTTKYDKNQIVEWEKGCHGPILSSNPYWDTPANGLLNSMPIQPATQWFSYPNQAC